MKVKMLNPLKTDSYDYLLPQNLIATHPIEPRENAKLLIYDRDDRSIKHDFFYNIQNYLPKDSALIFNDTKVIKARLFGKKSSGGKIELLINRPLNAHLVNVYIKGRIKESQEIFFDNELIAKVEKLHEDGSRDVSFTCKGILLRFEELLPVIEKIGHIPLPPYLQRNDNEEDRVNYQSVFAKFEGAVAAPTASLHFSDKLFQSVCKHHEHAFVTLHVGAGTFKPVQCEDITKHPMHSEYFSISDKAKKLLDSSKKIVAFGTTSTRTIEYYARTKQTSGEANLFLHPNNQPQRVDHLLTNFHLPKSTLLMLVASFVGLEATHIIYKEAIKKEYRFFSYGDAMLIL
jgi:S-adenosylmethionine:tRNA ribosyltransferase-isomerase